MSEVRAEAPGTRLACCQHRRRQEASAVERVRHRGRGASSRPEQRYKAALKTSFELRLREGEEGEESFLLWPC